MKLSPKALSLSAIEQADLEAHRVGLRRAVLERFDAESDPAGTNPGRNLWRFVMRHPALSLSAASMTLLAGIIASWSLLMGPVPDAYAELVEPLLNAKSGKFVLVAMRGDEEVSRGVGYFEGPVSRVEIDAAEGKVVTIHDGRTGMMLSLQTGDRTATRGEIPFFERDRKAAPQMMEKYGGGMLGSFRMLLDPDSELQAFGEGGKRELIEEKTESGLRSGVRITTPAMVQTLWAKPESGEPDRVEIEVLRFAGVKTVLKDFHFGVPVDPELLTLEPPLGYRVIEAPKTPPSD